MSIVLDGTAGITTPEITSAGGPLVVNASAPDNSVVVNASGNVGIGTSSPSTNLHVYGTTDSQIRLQNSSNSHYVGNISGSMEIQSADIIKFLAGGATERARIDSSGNLLVGTTDSSPYIAETAYIVAINDGTRFAATFSASATSDRTVIRFTNPNGAVGGINTNGSSTSYVTSSDYRLKHDIQPMTGALAKVQQLKPVTYKWNADDSSGEGFIAHELAQVCPDAVSGEKDAVDAEGNPQYQGIDTSFLVATLTAAIQEQQALIESLTARVVALEGQP